MTGNEHLAGHHKFPPPWRLLASAAVLVLTTLTGCSADADPQSAEPSSPTSTTAGANTATDGQSDAPTGAPPPVADWEPPTPLSNRVDMSEQEKMAKRAANLALEAEVSGLEDPPKVELIRWITPEEWAPALVECANDRGFPVGYTTDGGIDSANIPGEQGPALELAMYECMAEYSIDPRLREPLNGEQRGILYDYLVSSYVSCLAKLDIEVSAPPTREVFMSTAEGDGWMPQSELPSNQVSEANAKCPALPRSDVLYGA